MALDTISGLGSIYGFIVGSLIIFLILVSVVVVIALEMLRQGKKTFPKKQKHTKKSKR